MFLKMSVEKYFFIYKIFDKYHYSPLNSQHVSVVSESQLRM